MEKITATSSEAQSADLVSANIEQLKALFPELITEGANGAAVNVDVLKALVGDHSVTDADEKYGLNWHGKRRARQLALTPSMGTLRPCPEESVDWDTTQNLMIEGDNLEVLKLLQKSYAGKVKLIYIDPPYNTGKDFVYPDNFQDNIKNYQQLMGWRDDEGQRTSSLARNSEASGRFHTDWLNMMYPRLKLARDLLKDDGFIMVSIDDIELHNLRFILDSIFGEENFEGSFIWEGGRKNDSRRVSTGHDYIVVYAKSSSLLKELDIRWRDRKSGLEEVYAKVEELKNAFKDDYISASKALQRWFKSLPEGSPAKEHSHYKMIDAKGAWYGDNISSPNPRANLTFEWKGYQPPANGWRYDRDAMKRLDEEGLLLYPESKERRIQYKRYLHLTETWSPSSVFYKDRRAASKDLSALMGAKIFDFPKAVDVIARLVRLATSQGELIIDFFAGSGATGEAVLDQNLSDGEDRRFILVQLPEPLDIESKDQSDAAKYCDEIGKPCTIAELTKERLRRAAAKVKTDNPLFSGDTGFRVFKLDHSNIRAWNPSPADLEVSLFDHQDHLLEGRSEADVLYELLLKLGLDLCVPIEQRTIADCEVHAVGGGVLITCLAEQIAREQVETLAQGIIDWHKELLSASGYASQDKIARETTCVFRDSAFEDDVAKTNLAAILEQYGIQNVRSL
ncbi:MAG: site-specific DNA-methyltransferase [Alcanivoracaceae bacterium]|nr:site-specific DNA-methyltransferase [Alcanivoracaceae bacterium]